MPTGDFFLAEQKLNNVVIVTKSDLILFDLFVSSTRVPANPCPLNLKPMSSFRALCEFYNDVHIFLMT